MRTLILLSALSIVPTLLAGQQHSVPSNFVEVGLGVGRSPSLPGWRSEANPLVGPSGYLRFVLPIGSVHVGVEWVGWLGRGTEAFQSGFPQPGVPEPEPQSRSVLLTRSHRNLIVVLGQDSGARLKAGVGLVSLDGIVHGADCCLDAAGQWKESRRGTEAVLGFGAPVALSDRVRLVVGLDLISQWVEEARASAVYGTIGVSWRLPIGEGGTGAERRRAVLGLR